LLQEISLLLALVQQLLVQLSTSLLALDCLLQVLNQLLLLIGVENYRLLLLIQSSFELWITIYSSDSRVWGWMLWNQCRHSWIQRSRRPIGKHGLRRDRRKWNVHGVCCIVRSWVELVSVDTQEWSFSHAFIQTFIVAVLKYLASFVIGRAFFVDFLRLRWELARLLYSSSCSYSTEI